MEIKLDDFIGQDEIKKSLTTLIASVRQKNKSLPHLLFNGFEGMGKLTLAKIVTNTLGLKTKIVSGRVIESPGDLSGILTNLEEGSVLIIEQIELIKKSVVDHLFQAISSCKIDILIDSGPRARNVQISLPQFSLIATVSNNSKLDKRFSDSMLVFNFVPYESGQIQKLISLYSSNNKIDLNPEVLQILAEYSQGTLSDALRLLDKAQKYAEYFNDGKITPDIVLKVVKELSLTGNSSNNERQSIPDDVKIYVWQRDEGRCVKCGSQENLEYDHIIPVSKGGSNTARNIQILCEKCNREKSSNLV